MMIDDIKMTTLIRDDKKLGLKNSEIMNKYNITYAKLRKILDVNRAILFDKSNKK